MTTFINSNGWRFNAPNDYSPMASKVFNSRIGIPRIHTRVGSFTCVIGEDEMFIGDTDEEFEPNVDSAFDRNRRYTMLMIIEYKARTLKHPTYRKLLKAVDAEKDRYSTHRWYVEVGGVRIPIQVSPRVDEKKARDAYLKHERRKRLPPHAHVVFM